MVKHILTFMATVMIISLFPRPALSLEPKGWSILYALGNNLTPLGSFRVGYDQWEFGKLNGWAYGVTKNFYFTESYYTSLGIALMPAQTGITFGFVGAAGLNWEIIWSICIRFEVAANANANANLFQQGILGVGYDF